jgi:hypothetical protein
MIRMITRIIRHARASSWDLHSSYPSSPCMSPRMESSNRAAPFSPTSLSGFFGSPRASQSSEASSTQTNNSSRSPRHPVSFVSPATPSGCSPPRASSPLASVIPVLPAAHISSTAAQNCATSPAGSPSTSFATSPAGSPCKSSIAHESKFREICTQLSSLPIYSHIETANISPDAGTEVISHALQDELTVSRTASHPGPNFSEVSTQPEELVFIPLSPPASPPAAFLFNPILTENCLESSPPAAFVPAESIVHSDPTVEANDGSVCNLASLLSPSIFTVSVSEVPQNASFRFFPATPSQDNLLISPQKSPPKASSPGLYRFTPVPQLPPGVPLHPSPSPGMLKSPVRRSHLRSASSMLSPSASHAAAFDQSAVSPCTSQMESITIPPSFLRLSSPQLTRLEHDSPSTYFEQVPQDCMFLLSIDFSFFI